MYGSNIPPGTNTAIAGGGMLAATGAPPALWLLATALALVVAGALATRSARLEHDPIPTWFRSMNHNLHVR